MAYTKYPAAKELISELKQGKTRHTYLMLGEEEGEKDKIIARITGMIIPDEEDRRTNTGRFHLDTDPLLGAADFALSSSMFSQKRVCVIRNIDSLKSGKENRRLFSDMLENLPESSCLIMTAGKNRPPDFIPSNFLKKIGVYQFWRHFDSDIFRYVQNSLQRHGMMADDRAIKAIIMRTGNDIKKIDEAIEMLRYSGLESPLTTAVVENIISDQRDVSIYEFIEALFSRKASTLRLYKKIAEEGVPEGRIFYEINRHLDQLEKYYYLTSRGSGIDEAIKACGVFSKNRDKFLSFTRSYSEEKLKKIYPILGDTEVKRKSGSLSKRPVSSPVFELTMNMLKI